MWVFFCLQSVNCSEFSTYISSQNYNTSSRKIGCTIKKQKQKHTHSKRKKYICLDSVQMQEKKVMNQKKQIIKQKQIKIAHFSAQDATYLLGMN